MRAGCGGKETNRLMWRCWWTAQADPLESPDGWEVDYVRVLHGWPWSVPIRSLQILGLRCSDWVL